jgi:hypothetical protein
MSAQEIKVEPIAVESGVKAKRHYEMTPARKEAFERCVAARREIVEFRKNMKASPEFKEAKKAVRSKIKKQVISKELSESESELSQEEQLVTKKKAPKTMEKKKKFVMKKPKENVKQEKEEKKEEEEKEEEFDDDDEDVDDDDDDSMDSRQMKQMKNQIHTQKRMKMSHERLYGADSAQGVGTKYSKDAFVFL